MPYGNNYCILVVEMKTYLSYVIISIRDWKVIPCVDKYLHLGTHMYSNLYHDYIKNAVHDLNRKTNYLVADIAFTKTVLCLDCKHILHEGLRTTRK